MSKARDLSNFISDATVDATEIADLAVTHAKLHTDMNLSSKTLTFAADQISGNSVDGGVISNFASTGIDDNASSTAVTILSGGNVGIGTDNPSTKLHVDGGGSSPEIRIAQNSTYYTDIGINHIDVAGNDLRFLFDGNEKGRYTNEGVLGLGVIPGAWSANYPALQIGGGATFTGHASNTQTQLGQNWWIGTGNQYIVNGTASRLIMNPDSTIKFSQAPSGTAGATMSTIYDRLTINPSGNVGIGISPTHLLHVQAGSTGNGDVKIGGGAGLLISHNNSAATVQTIKSLYHTTSANSNLRIVTGFLTVSTGTSDTERLRLKSNGSFEIGYAGAGLQQADNQAMTITTPASGGGQGIAIKRLDSNTDQQIGEITFSNNTQDGQAGIRVKTQGAVNTTDMHFDVNNAGTTVTALSIDGSAGGIITMDSQPSANVFAQSGNAGAYNNTASNSVVVANGIRHNIGGHYNTSNGRFTCPTGGRYFVSFSGNWYNSSAGSWIRPLIRKNGATYTQHYENTANNPTWMHISASAIIDCSTGDYLDIYNSTHSGAGGGTDVNQYSNINFHKIA